MASYQFEEIEEKWQQYWEKHQTFKAENQSDKPKFFALDMFPYPSGAGLHVGHPLGYIATDIVARYKKLKGFNVLHPMGFDSFGLPAEQYAIQTGQHPAITTENNINTYKRQLKQIGFAYDWDREVRTSDPSYYKWTQWIFRKIFDSWYNKATDKAEPIATLIAAFEQSGNAQIDAVCDEDTPAFSAQEWKSMGENRQQEILLKYRLAFLAETTVNWCPALGTVLSNDEVKDGFSERGGHPVIRKNMMQWMMRITAYADRLLKGLDNLDWTEAVKEMQRNWIGKSEGAMVEFSPNPTPSPVEKANGRGVEATITVFTTRPDTIFGATFLTLAPEHELVPKITSPDRKAAVEAYVQVAKNRSERDRMTDVKTVSGEFTGAYAKHPFTGQPIPIWIGDYVLAGYGTGAVMGVPAHDSRDHAFAKHFGLEIRQVVTAPEGWDIQMESYDAKEGTAMNSDFLNGLDTKASIKKAIEEIENMGIGEGKINFRMRDAIFTRQRYWGEPLPVYFKDGLPYLVDEKDLPLLLPEVDKYLPTEDGAPPLGRAKNWVYKKEGQEYPLEMSTMPGWAGSSWYWFRYMDPENENAFCSRDAQKYWQNVDLYIGGTEHATGHLLYARFWCKFLYDMGLVTVDEPFKKLINQGMIQGMSAKSVLNSRIMRSKVGPTRSIVPEYFPFKPCLNSMQEINYPVDELELVVKDGKQYYKLTADAHLKSSKKYSFLSDVMFPDHDFFDQLFNSRIHHEEYDYQESPHPDKTEAELRILNDWIKENEGIVYLNAEVEKMSKSKLNVVNPDDICAEYGADTLRLYEMFLGPLEQSKPWNTHGIDGVFRFLKKLWNLFHDAQGNFNISDEAPTKEELKTLHKTIKKVEEDIDRFSFNTSVSSFMICVNELSALKCNKRAILKDLLIIISPYAPHIAEELWSGLGEKNSIAEAQFPSWDKRYLEESTFNYPISINGKHRANLEFPVDMPTGEIEKAVLGTEAVQKWMEGKPAKKVIVVPKKIVNVVV